MSGNSVLPESCGSPVEGMPSCRFRSARSHRAIQPGVRHAGVTKPFAAHDCRVLTPTPIRSAACSGSPAADGAAQTVSRLAATAILYPGQRRDPITVSVAIGRGTARIHVISQGAHRQHGRARSTVTAVAPAATGLTIICALSEEFAVEGPDKCLTFHIAGSARSFLPGGPSDDHRLPEGGPVGSGTPMISKIALTGWTAYAAWFVEEVGDTLAALDGLVSIEAEAAISADQVFGPDGGGDAGTWSAEAARLEAEQ